MLPETRLEIFLLPHGGLFRGFSAQNSDMEQACHGSGFGTRFARRFLPLWKPWKARPLCRRRASHRRCSCAFDRESHKIAAGFTGGFEASVECVEKQGHANMPSSTFSNSPDLCGQVLENWTANHLLGWV
jgi:hypothetical protein